MPSMPMGPVADRWCRLLLVALLVLPIPAALGPYADEGGVVVSDPTESDQDRLRLAAGTLVDSAWILSAPMSVRLAGGSDARDPVVAGWACRIPADRAPPRA
jgi:hypothetical protein